MSETDCVLKEFGNCSYSETGCSDCKVKAKIRNALSVQPEPCEDVVSRQRLLSDLKELIAAWNKYPEMAEHIKGVETAIRYVGTIPSAQPESKTGHWVGHREHCEMNNLRPSGLGSYFWCSNCDCGIDVKEWHKHNYNYCPNCGCRMVDPRRME